MSPCGPVLNLLDRGVVNMPEYLDTIFAKLVSPRPVVNFEDTLYSRSFSCPHCALAVIEAIKERLVLMQIHNYHILPPCPTLATSSSVVRLFNLLVFTFEHGPIIPVVLATEPLGQQQRLVHELYTSPVFPNLKSE